VVGLNIIVSLMECGFGSGQDRLSVAQGFAEQPQG
jgi:hypothetical protein